MVFEAVGEVVFCYRPNGLPGREKMRIGMTLMPLVRHISKQSDVTIGLLLFGLLSNIRLPQQLLQP